MWTGCLYTSLGDEMPCNANLQGQLAMLKACVSLFPIAVSISCQTLQTMNDIFFQRFLTL